MLSHDVLKNIFPTSSTHRLQHGLRGYLILLLPCFRSQCPVVTSKLPSHLVFFLISTNFTSTLEITYLYHSKLKSFDGSSKVEPWDFTINFLTTYELFKPVIPTTLGPSYYRGCWHEVSRTFLFGTVIFFPTKEFYNPRASSLTHRSSGFPICKIPHCCPVGLEPCLSPNVAGLPLRTAIDRCLASFTLPTS